jgi:hypothetical protein
MEMNLTLKHGTLRKIIRKKNLKIIEICDNNYKINR